MIDYKHRSSHNSRLGRRTSFIDGAIVICGGLYMVAALTIIILECVK
jgi:hypothetical protein